MYCCLKIKQYLFNERREYKVEFSWLAWLVTIAFVVAEGLVSVRERTFSRKQMRSLPIRLSFLWHWGVVIGDLCILPIFNGLVVPYFHLSLLECVAFLFVSFAVTLVCHFAWWPTTEKALGFIYADWNGSSGIREFWYRDITVAGWMHVMFMTVELVAIALYILVPMPGSIVWRVGIIFLVFVLLGVIEPGVIEGWPLSRKKILATFGFAITLWFVVIAVTWFKM